MTTPPFETYPPHDEGVTSYDERHLVTYLRLLDAEAEGADWREAVSIIFAIDVAKDPVLAKAVYDSHLARARWMTEAGYRDLLKR